MWGLAAWVERFQAELWVKQTGTPFTGRVGKFAVRAIWADVDQLDLEVDQGAKMTFKTKKAPGKLGWVWQFTPIEPSRKSEPGSDYVSPDRGEGC